MFRAYAVDLDEIGSLIADERVEYNYDNADEEKINSSLGNILKADVNLLNGDELIECFFPSKCCHVFLCHSGLDKDRVKLFARWLKVNFDIVSFIDSDLWDGVEQLKQEIEAGKKKTNDYFSYEISEHAHVMLCHALTKMIDYAECFIFLKSSNSSTSQQSLKKPGTFSPWIFYELSSVEMIREKHSHRKSLPVELCEKELQDEREEDNSDACAHSVDKEENGDANALRENKDGKNALFEVEGGKNYDKMNALFECINQNGVKICYPIPPNMSHLKIDVLERWIKYIRNLNSEGTNISRLDDQAQIDFCNTVGDGSKYKWEIALNWLYRNN